MYVYLMLYLKWFKYVIYILKEVMYFFILKKISVMLYVLLFCKKYFEFLINLVNRFKFYWFLKVVEDVKF